MWYFSPIPKTVFDPNQSERDTWRLMPEYLLTNTLENRHVQARVIRKMAPWTKIHDRTHLQSMT